MNIYALILNLSDKGSLVSINSEIYSDTVLNCPGKMLDRGNIVVYKLLSVNHLVFSPSTVSTKKKSSRPLREIKIKIFFISQEQ